MWATDVMKVKISLNCISGHSGGDPLSTSPLPLKGRVVLNLYRFHWELRAANCSPVWALLTFQVSLTFFKAFKDTVTFHWKCSQRNCFISIIFVIVGWLLGEVLYFLSLILNLLMLMRIGWEWCLWKWLIWFVSKQMS